jgi:hypothetical protein
LPEYTEWYVLDINSDGFHTIQSGRKEWIVFIVDTAYTDYNG